MNTTPKISVIVPVYNAEKYLHRCIDSILSQTFTDFELLLINDGSKDSSGAICDEYAAKDNRVRVFHKENGGVSSARNLGLDNANGEWIAFVDSDDWVESNYLYNYIVNISHECEILANSVDSGIVSSVDFINDMLFDKQSWCMYYKLYKKECLKLHSVLNVPRELNIGEDIITNISLAQNIKYVKYIKNDGYCVREHMESATKTRVWSIDYECKFLSYIKKQLGDNKAFDKGFWLLNLRSVKNLLLNGVDVSRSNPIYRYVLDNKCDIPLGVRDRLVLNCPFPLFTMFLLRMTKNNGF